MRRLTVKCVSLKVKVIWSQTAPDGVGGGHRGVGVSQVTFSGAAPQVPPLAHQSVI